MTAECFDYRLEAQIGKKEKKKREIFQHDGSFLVDLAFLHIFIYLKNYGQKQFLINFFTNYSFDEKTLQLQHGRMLDCRML